MLQRDQLFRLVESSIHTVRIAHHHHHHIRFWYLWCCGCPGLRVGNTWQRLTLVLHEFLSNGLTPSRLHIVISFLTHADHIFLGLPRFLVLGTPNRVMELMQVESRELKTACSHTTPLLKHMCNGLARPACHAYVSTLAWDNGTDSETTGRNENIVSTVHSPQRHNCSRNITSKCGMKIQSKSVCFMSKKIFGSANISN